MFVSQALADILISTHALREEGDTAYAREPLDKRDFYPRPPRGGRPWHTAEGCKIIIISTHALREEGDEANQNRNLGSC